MIERDETQEYIEHILNDVSDEKITDLFQEMGIEINLNKPWSDEDA